jgi:hypothetical protein
LICLLPPTKCAEEEQLIELVTDVENQEARAQESARHHVLYEECALSNDICFQ